jgi:hypothetical protein
MGCLRRLGCLALVLVLAAAGAFLYYTRWGPGRTDRAVASAGDSAWEPLTPAGAARARAVVARLERRGGRVYENVNPGDLSAYVFEELAKGTLPPSTEDARAAVIDSQLYVRATVKLSDFGGKRELGPLGAMLGEREPVQFGGTLELVRPGLAQYRLKSIRVRELSIPPPMIPKLVRNLDRGPRPEGLAPDGLPLEVPAYISDVRVGNGTITVFKGAP